MRAIAQLAEEVFASSDVGRVESADVEQGPTPRGVHTGLLFLYRVALICVGSPAGNATVVSYRRHRFRSERRASTER